MFKIEKQWKEFNISLEKLDVWARKNLEHYTGNQAHSLIEFWFEEEPSDKTKKLLDKVWDVIDKKHEFATGYFSLEDFLKAEKFARADAVLKNYDDLTTQQKKLLLRVDLTLEDKTQLIKDFSK